MYPAAPLTSHPTLRDTTVPATQAVPGFYLRPRPQGFAAHLCASPRNLCAVR